jgi:hypothetical protein
VLEKYPPVLQDDTYDDLLPAMGVVADLRPDQLRIEESQVCSMLCLRSAAESRTKRVVDAGGLALSRDHVRQLGRVPPLPCSRAAA